MNLVHCSQGHSNPVENHFCQYCGEPISVAKSRSLPNGMVLGDRYRIVRELSKGGFTETYLAQDTNRQLYVLKEFAPQVQGDDGLQKAQELFEREAGVLYKLQHPQIPKFRELFRASRSASNGQERLFLVQDYADGETYSDILNTRKQQGVGFSEAEVIELFQHILPLLAYIHSMGVIHRDISPDNLILRTQDRKPVLINFGGVKEVAVKAELQYSPSGLAGQSTIVPTCLSKPGYAPREQMQRGVVSPHSDLYALAATALALLTCKEPDRLLDTQTLTWDWSKISHVSPKLRATLEKMLRSTPAERYQSAPEVLQAIDAPDLQYIEVATSPSSLEPIAIAAVAVPSEAESTVPPSVPRKDAAAIVKIISGLLIIAGAGVLGWLGGTWWTRAQVGTSASNATPTPTAIATATATPEIDNEAQRQQALQQHRQKLELEPTFYQELVDRVFAILNPEYKDKILGDTPEEANLRSQRDKAASDLLNQIEQLNLSSQARKDLGTYNSADRQQWISRINRLRLSSRSLKDLVDTKFNAFLPQYTAKTLNLGDRDWLNAPLGQLWYAIAADTVPLLESRSALETVEFEPGTSTKQLSGTLKLGEGKAYITRLSARQALNLKLEAPPQVLISVYSPSGAGKILENSTERSWSGNLPESGYYEVVITASAPGASNYKLEMSVSNAGAIASPVPVN